MLVLSSAEQAQTMVWCTFQDVETKISPTRTQHPEIVKEYPGASPKSMWQRRKKSVQSITGYDGVSRGNDRIMHETKEMKASVHQIFGRTSDTAIVNCSLFCRRINAVATVQCGFCGGRSCFCSRRRRGRRRERFLAAFRYYLRRGPCQHLVLRQLVRGMTWVLAGDDISAAQSELPRRYVGHGSGSNMATWQRIDTLIDLWCEQSCNCRILQLMTCSKQWQ